MQPVYTLSPPLLCPVVRPMPCDQDLCHARRNVNLSSLSPSPPSSMSATSHLHRSEDSDLGQRPS
eukprot:176615-Rhodomonas_salina.2